VVDDVISGYSYTSGWSSHSTTRHRFHTTQQIRYRTHKACQLYTPRKREKSKIQQAIPEAAEMVEEEARHERRGERPAATVLMVLGRTGEMWQLDSRLYVSREEAGGFCPL
jgi:hypothetical protein